VDIKDGTVMRRSIVQPENAPDLIVGIALESVSEARYLQLAKALALMVKSGVVAGENETELSETHPMNAHFPIDCKSAPNDTLVKRMLL
jgi:hypothetical protein